MTHPHARSATPWATGSALAVFVFATTVVAVFAFGSVLAGVSPLLALAVNVVAGAGAAPTLWSWARVPLWRWVIAGIVVGVPVGWLMVLATFV